MEKSQRAALIAERFKKNHPFAVVENQGKTREGLWRRRPYCMDRNPRGQTLGMRYTNKTATERQKIVRLMQSVGKEQTETRAPELRPKRAKRVSAVTRIAEKAPKKLKRRVASAEQLLAERARR